MERRSRQSTQRSVRVKNGFNFQLFSSLHAWLRSWLNVIDTSPLRVKFTDSHNLCESWDQSPLMLSGSAPRDISSSITPFAERKTVRAREHTVNDLWDASIVFPSVATLLICQRAPTYFRRFRIIVAANRNNLICGVGGRDGNHSARSLHAVCVSTRSVWVWGGKTFVCPSACEQYCAGIYWFNWTLIDDVLDRIIKRHFICYSLMLFRISCCRLTQIGETKAFSFSCRVRWPGAERPTERCLWLIQSLDGWSGHLSLFKQWAGWKKLSHCQFGLLRNETGEVFCPYRVDPASTTTISPHYRLPRT